MNTNKYFKLGLITMFLAFFGQLSFAQEVIVADTIEAEEAFGKKPITPFSALPILSVDERPCC